MIPEHFWVWLKKGKKIREITSLVELRSLGALLSVLGRAEPCWFGALAMRAAMSVFRKAACQELDPGPVLQLLNSPLPLGNWVLRIYYVPGISYA